MLKLATYTPFEKYLISKGGARARFAERLHDVRTRSKPESTVTVRSRETDKAGITSLSPTIVEEPEPEPTARRMPAFKIPEGGVPGSVAERITTAIKDVDEPEAPPITKPKYPIVYGTGTPEQLLGKTGGFEPKKPDTGFYKPSEIEKRREEMALSKEHYIGRDTENKPVHITITEAKYHHGYTPGLHDPNVIRTYSKVEEDVRKNLAIASSNIEMIKTAKGYIPDVVAFIKQLETAPKGATVTYTEVLPSGAEKLHENVSSQEALVFFKSYLGDLQETAGQLSTYEKTEQQLIEQEKIIGGYKEHGYVLEETDKGYTIDEPESSKVYLWKHGAEISGIALTSASFLASPLAIQTVGSAIQYFVTGDEKVRKAEFERLSEYALGLDVAIKKGEYVGRVIISPAMVEGFYIPVLTFGTAKVISMGVSGASPYILSGAGKVSTTFTKLVGQLPSRLQTVVTVSKEPIKFAGRGGLRLLGTRTGKAFFKYGLYLGLEGGELAKLRPEIIGGELTKSLFRYELQWRAMELGFKDTKFYRQRWVEKDILKTKDLPLSIRKQKVVGRLDVVHKPITDTKGKFGVFGKTAVKTEGQKPLEVIVDVRGFTKSYPSFKYTEARGIGKFKWWGREGLKKVEHISFRPVESTSQEIAKIGKERLIFSTERTMGKIEPYTGESLTRVFRADKADKMIIDFFVSKGKFQNIIEDIVGEHRILGISYGLKGADTKTFDLIGSKLVQEVVSVTKTATPFVGMKITVAKPLKTFATGIGATITKEVDKIVVTKTKPIVVTKADVIQEVDVKTKPVVLVGTKTRQILKEKQKVDTGLKTISVTKPKSVTAEKELVITEPVLDIFEEDKEIYEPVVVLDVSQAQMQKQQQLQRVGLKTTSLLETDAISITDLISISPTSPIIPIPGIPILLGDEMAKPLLVTKGKPKETGFDVYVKERSMYHGKIIKPTKFTKRNIHALSRDDALGLGATIADESSAISFKIKSTKEKPKNLLMPSKSFKEIGHKFTKKGEVYIEKNKFRLDSPGEQREISALGRKTRKQNLLSNKKVDLGIKKVTKKRRKKNVRYI